MSSVNCQISSSGWKIGWKIFSPTRFFQQPIELPYPSVVLFLSLCSHYEVADEAAVGCERSHFRERVGKPCLLESV